MTEVHRKFYITEARLKALRVLREATEPLYGAQVTEMAGLAHGTVYPILRSFARQGWVMSVEEPGPYPAPPSRIYYQLTQEGRQQAKTLLNARCR